MAGFIAVVKFLSRLLTALNFDPSIATLAFARSRPPRRWCTRAGRCTEGGPRADRRATPLKFFPQGVHSGAERGSRHGPNRGWLGLRHLTQPRERTMTIDRMTLKALIEKGSDDDLLREMMAYPET